MSRTRLIRPEFYADEAMASLTLTTRYVYIGLWTLCDDAGYFERKPRQIAAALFPYEGQARRQKIVDRALVELVEARRVKYLDCEIHGVVPTLPKHGAKGGTKAETFLSRHRTTCLSEHVRPSTYKSSSDSVSVSGSDSVSEGAQAREEPVDFAAAMAAAGLRDGLAKTKRPVTA